MHSVHPQGDPNTAHRGEFKTPPPPPLGLPPYKVQFLRNCDRIAQRQVAMNRIAQRQSDNRTQTRNQGMH